MPSEKIQHEQKFPFETESTSANQKPHPSENKKTKSGTQYKPQTTTAFFFFLFFITVGAYTFPFLMLERARTLALYLERKHVIGCSLMLASPSCSISKLIKPHGDRGSEGQKVIAKRSQGSPACWKITLAYLFEANQLIFSINGRK